MRLKEIKLAGFKSFVDPTSFAIPGQVVGIVGPNGCGKSNVIDAVRWVLGESSARQLRGETMQDVIFNGAGGRKPSARASVELIFDNALGKAGGEWSKYGEIAIRRVLEREGNSEYYINGIHVRRRDVSDLFLGTGAGARGYSIIEQGMISQIIEAKPEEMRVFLEEAAGVSKYRERRRETELRIGDTRDNLQRVTDIREELAKQLEHLEGQAEVAAKYRDLQAQLGSTQNLLWYTRRQEAGAQRARLARDIDRTTVEVEAEGARLRDAEKRAEELRVRFYSASDAVSTAQAGFFQAGSEVARLEQQIQHVRDSRSRVEAQLAQAERQLERFGSERTETARALEEWRGKLEQATSVLEERTERAAAESERLPETESAYRAARERVTELRSSLAQVEQQLRVEATRREHAQKLVEQLDTRRMRLEQERSALVAPDSAEVAQLREEQAYRNEELAQLRETLATDAARLPHLEQAWREATQAAEAVVTRIAGLEATRNALEALQAQLARSENVKDWIEHHDLAGRKRLWQGMRIEPGWEDALEAALGMRLNAIAVERLDAGQGWARDRPPAKVALFSAASDTGSAAPTESWRGLQPLVAFVACDDPAVSAVLPEWLGGIHVVESVAAALDLRHELPPGCSLVSREGHLFTRHSVSFHAPDNELHGVLSRQREIERLGSALDAERVVLEDRRHIEEEREQSVIALRNRLASLRSEIEALGERGHEQELEILRLSEQVERTAQRAAQISRELDEIGAQAQIESEQLETAAQSVAELDAQMRERRDELADADEALRDTEAAAAEQRRAAQQAEKDSQEAVFAQKSCTQRISDLTEAGRRLEDQAEQFAANRERLAEDVGRFDDTPLAAELQTALGMRSERESVLTGTRDELQGIENELRETEQQRLTAEQRLGPLRDRVGDLRLKEQEARLVEEQFARQLVESGANEEELAQQLAKGTRSSHLNTEITRLGEEIAALGAVNLAALEELGAARERKAYLDAQSTDLEQALGTLEDAIKRIDRETRELLSKTYEEVNRHFGELFPTLFGGGQAKLVLTGDEILDAGIQVVAQPPGKRNSSIHLLSGGEKALTALSLVFAMFRLNPAPFCLLDEVDAPLDDSNTVRFCKLVKLMSAETQFMFISHNKITMEIAEQLVGVTMQELGVSRVVAVDIDEAMKLTEQQAA